MTPGLKTSEKDLSAWRLPTMIIIKQNRTAAAIKLAARRVDFCLKSICLESRILV